jgi:hypothetical protein
LINGTGLGAAGYPLLKNQYQIQSLPTTVLTANNNVTVYAGNVITQANNTATGTVYTSSTGNTIVLVGVTGVFTTGANTWIYNDFANLSSNINSVTSYTQFVNQSYNTVRTFDTTLNFDRITYSSNVVTWKPNITVSANSRVSYNGQAYQANTTVYSSAILGLSGNIVANIGDYITQANTTANSVVTANLFAGNLGTITVANLSANYTRRWGNILINGIDSNVVPTTITNVFDYSKYNLLNANVFTAADRITAYYQPTTGMLGNDLSQLMSGISYPGVSVTGVKFNANTSVVTNTGNLYTVANTLSVYSSNLQVVNFTTLGYTIGQPLTIINNTTSTKYITQIAAITPAQLVVPGMNANIALGSNISLVYYDFKNPVYLDTNIQNTYKNTTFGSNIGDVTIDGGAYYDTYSSHAPEELVPGATFEHLNLTVTTKLQNGTSLVSYLIEHNMQANSSATYNLYPKYYGINYNLTTTLTSNLLLTDSNIHVTNANLVTAPNLSTVTPGVVFINGEKITFWTVDYTNNVLGQIRRAVDGTGAAAVHAAGSIVTSINTPNIIPGGNLTHTYATTQAWLNAPPGASLFVIDEFGNQILANVAGTQTSLVTIGPAGSPSADGSGLEGAIFGATPSVQAAFLGTLIKSTS